MHAELIETHEEVESLDVIRTRPGVLYECVDAENEPVNFDGTLSNHGRSYAIRLNTVLMLFVKVSRHCSKSAIMAIDASKLIEVRDSLFFKPSTRELTLVFPPAVGVADAEEQE